MGEEQGCKNEKNGFFLIFDRMNYKEVTTGVWEGGRDDGGGGKGNGMGFGVGGNVARSFRVGEGCSSPGLFSPPSVNLDHQKYFLVACT